jgi:hypothetical protein
MTPDPLDDFAWLVLSRDEAKQLRDCLLHTYISHDTYPLVIDIMRRFTGIEPMGPDLVYPSKKGVIDNL